MQPGEGTFNYPAEAAEPGAVLAAAASDHRPDPSLAEFAAMASVVVTAVGDEFVGATAGTADTAADRRHSVDERD
jgi:hypothetical protein